MKRTLAAMAVLLMLGSTASLLAHHSLARFDTTTAVRVKGAIVRFERVNPHSIIFVDQKLADGQVQRWAVDGPAASQLTRTGFNKETLKAGDVIEVCGYVLKEDVQPQERIVNTEPLSVDPKAATPKTMSGRVLNAETLVMPDGERRSWGDYGHHKCFEPGYRDQHSR